MKKIMRELTCEQKQTLNKNLRLVEMDRFINGFVFKSTVGRSRSRVFQNTH